ncbi:gp436 family protein [Oryzifoliimicrobium ureilyticus]|uniref:gp436 family protein n=1 Tax=Oryzifoliimicrobium ureilyticus TaxID=3113724 RepID=UPI0030762839
MTYCTKQDLIDRFGETELVQVTDRMNKPASTIDDTVVNRALSDATALIDGYIGKAYKLPLAAVPDSLVKASADIARYYLHFKGVDKESPVQRAYDQAVTLLLNVSKGLVQLVEDTGTAPAPAGDGMVQFSGAERVFTRCSLRGF